MSNLTYEDFTDEVAKRMGVEPGLIKPASTHWDSCYLHVADSWITVSVGKLVFYGGKLNHVKIYKGSQGTPQAARILSIIKEMEEEKMSKQKVTIIDEKARRLPKIADLAYGVLLTGVPSNPQCIYRKVQKHQIGSGLSLQWSHGHCVLFNIQHGTLREIDGDTLVQPLVCDNMEVYAPSPDQYGIHGLLK